MAESKSQKFKRLAEARVNRAIRDLRSIGNLSNTSNYEYGQAEVRKIVSALRKELSALERRFQDASGSDADFKLD